MSMFVTYEQNVDILHAHRTCNIELTRCPYDYLACGWMDFIYLALDKRLLSCFLALCILHLHLMVMIARWFSESPTSYVRTMATDVELPTLLLFVVVDGVFWRWWRLNSILLPISISIALKSIYETSLFDHYQITNGRLNKCTPIHAK